MMNESTKPSIRRSLRLNGHQGINKNNVIVQIEERPPAFKRRRTVKAEASSSDAATSSCVADPQSRKRDSSSELRISCIVTPVDLAKREKALIKREQEFKRKSDDLDGRMSRLSEKEEKASLLMSQIAEREAKTILFQLEEHFTCALCYDILACPISLNPGQCGHTFCAICILKWFFSRLHKACGGWHESVDCPICRSLLIITPDRLPRPDITFPFTPNRTVDAVLQDLVGKLAAVSTERKLVVKEEEDSDGSALGAVSMKKEKEVLHTAGIDAWRVGGTLRSEWLRRDRDGREKINHVTKSWATLTSQEFVEIKTNLGV